MSALSTKWWLSGDNSVLSVNKLFDFKFVVLLFEQITGFHLDQPDTCTP